MLWIATFDTNSCRIYNFDKIHSKLLLVKELNHPELRQKTGDNFTTERPGHYQTDESVRGAYSPHMDPREVEIDNFAREIAEELDKGRNSHLFEKLIIIAAPHMHGLLNHHLNKHVKNLIINNVQKDLQHFNERELLNFLNTHVQYPDE